MLRAVCEDLVQLTELQVSIQWDLRLPPALRPPVHCLPVADAEEEERAFDQLAADCDHTLLIVPELDGWLLSRCRRAVAVGAKLISPPPALVALASDKCATAAWLQQAGLPVPLTYRVQSVDELPRSMGWPAVMKPNDGAGSVDVQLVTYEGAQSLLVGRQTYCLQAYCIGRAASVAAICGPQQQLLLPPCWQNLDPTTYAYLGGSLITDPAERERATRLAQQAIACLPSPIGYLGLDLVLGPCSDGSSDYLIEINPRLTSSYLGLAAAAEQNLGQAMWRIAAGARVALSFRSGPLQFEASGRIRMDPPSEPKDS